MGTNNKSAKAQSNSKSTGSTKQTESSTQSPTKQFIDLMKEGVAKATRMSIEAENSAKGQILGMR